MISSSPQTSPPLRSSINCRPAWASIQSPPPRQSSTLCRRRRTRYPSGRLVSSIRQDLPHLWRGNTSPSRGRNSTWLIHSLGKNPLVLLSSLPPWGSSAGFMGLKWSMGSAVSSYHHLHTVFMTLMRDDDKCLSFFYIYITVTCFTSQSRSSHDSISI